MRMNYETQVETELDDALARAGIVADNVPGSRDAVRELTRTITANTARNPEAALRMAAESIARTIHLAATAPARGGAIPQVTFLPPPTDKELAQLEAALDGIAASSERTVHLALGYPERVIRKTVTR